MAHAPSAHAIYLSESLFVIICYILDVSKFVKCKTPKFYAFIEVV